MKINKLIIGLTLTAFLIPTNTLAATTRVERVNGEEIQTLNTELETKNDQSNPIVVDSGINGNVVWNIYEDNTANITAIHNSDGIMTSKITGNLMGFEGVLTIEENVIFPANCSELFSSYNATELIIKNDTNNVTNMRSMFAYMKQLKSLDLGEKFDTSNVTNMAYMFYSNDNLQMLDLKDNFDTSSVTDMQGMFRKAQKLIKLNLGNNFDTSRVTKLQEMFAETKSIQTLNLGAKFDTSEAKNMGFMFEQMHSLKELDLGQSFDTSKVTDMTSMFQDVESLEYLNLGDKFNTSNVTDMSAMFNMMFSLKSLDLGAKFNTSKVSDMLAMFQHMESLTSLDLGQQFYTDNSPRLYKMFSFMYNLESLNLGENFNTRNVSDMEAIFLETSKLKEVFLPSEAIFSDKALETITSQYDYPYTGKWVIDDNAVPVDDSLKNLLSQNDNRISGTYFMQREFNVTFITTELQKTITLTTFDQYINLNEIPAVPDKDGYVFIGWSTDEHGLSSNFDPETAYITEDITIYAIYKETLPPSVFKVTFNVEGKTTVIDVKDQEKIALDMVPNTEREGFTFIGWSTIANAENADFDITTQLISEDVTLYAVYKNSTPIPLPSPITPDTLPKTGESNQVVLFGFCLVVISAFVFMCEFKKTRKHH